MSANVEAMVREGIAAYKDGRKDEARALLTKATELDQFNEQAWLYLSGVVETPEDQRICLENVLSINPLNEKAKKGLAFLDGEEVSFEKPKPQPVVKPPTVMPTSVEWDAPADPSSAATRTPPPPLISDDEYDSWVTGLNLPSSAPGAPAQPEPEFSRQTTAFDEEFVGTPFTDADFGDDLLDGPFKTNDASAPPANDRIKLRVYDFGTPAAVIADAAKDSMFGDKDASPQESRRDRARREKDEKRAEREKAKETKAAAKATKKAAVEPVTSDDDLFGTSEVTVTAPDNRDYTLFNDIDADADGIPMEESEGELFGMIPIEIKPTRLPGTRERLPLVGVLMLILLLVLNVGAFGFLVMQLISTLNRV